MKNKRIIGLSLTLLGLLLMYVGTYAYYVRVVNGTITGKTGAFTFDVLHNNKTFTSIDLYETMENPSLTSKYIIPGDSGKFDLLVDATGSSTGVEYEIDFVGTNIPTNMKFYLDENKTEEVKLEYGLLGYIKSTDETKNKLYTIYWEWPYDSGYNNDDDINYQNKEMIFDVTATGKQSSGYAMMKNVDTKWHTGYGGTGMWLNKHLGYIETITFSRDLSILPNSCTEENNCYDISDTSSPYPVYNYLVKNENNYWDAYIVSEKEIYAPKDSSGLFSLYWGNGNTVLKSINFNNSFNTSKVIDMNHMFYVGATTLENLDLSFFDTSNVTNMSYMLQVSVEDGILDLSSFDTSNVTDMRGMFNTNIASLDLSNFNTSKVTNMYSMFGGCSQLTNISFGSGFDTSNVTDMEGMFSWCESLTSIKLSSFNTSKVTNMQQMFDNCSSLTSLDLSNFNTSKVTNMHEMFSTCTNLTTTITIRNANVKDYDFMFSSAATASNAKITVNYTTETESLVDKMIATKSSNSNVVKGTKQ